MYRKTGEEDEIDVYEGNDENAFDHITGEIDYDRLLEGLHEEGCSESAESCGCLDPTAWLCSACEHTLDCDSVACVDEIHKFSLEYGNPKECLCASTPKQLHKCEFCGHKKSCEDEVVSNCSAVHDSSHAKYAIAAGAAASATTLGCNCGQCGHEAGFDPEPKCVSQELLSETLKNEATFKRKELEPDDFVLSNAGKAWSLREDQKLIKGYSVHQSLDSLAKNHSRSTAAIWMRLVLLSFQAEAKISDELKQRAFEISDWGEDACSVVTASLSVGISVPKLADVLDKDVVDVARKVVELGLANPKVLPKYREVNPNRRWTSAELAQLREDFRHQLPIDLMAENAERSKISVLSMLYALGEISDDEVNEMLSRAAPTAYGT